MADTWHINNTPLSTLALANLHLSYVSLAPDTLSFDAPQASFAADPRFPYDSKITLTRDGIVVFSGRITQIPRFAGEKAESISYIAEGPFKQLDEIAFLQNYKINTTPTASNPTFNLIPAGRIIPNTDDQGRRIPLSTALANIISYAAAAGVPVQVGSIQDLDVSVPLDETTDLSCAAVIQRLLAWAPDTVSWFDYTATPPALHIARADSLATTSIPIAAASATFGAPPAEITINPRHDLVVPGVILLYRRTNAINENRWITIETDKAPPNASITAPRALVRTIDLKGSVESYSTASASLRQKVTTRSVPGNLPSGTLALGDSGFDAMLSFFSRHGHGWMLKDELRQVIGFRNFSRTGKTPTQENPDPDWGAYDAGCSNEIIDGAIPTSALSPNTRIQTQKFTVEIAYLTRRRKADGSLPNWPNLQTVTQNQKSFDTLSIELNMTTAANRTFSLPVEIDDSDDYSYEAQEAAPAGVAATLYAALSRLQYEGRLTVIAPEPLAIARPGKAINITGSRPEWENMRAIIQQSTLHLDTGETTLTIGPPAHLGPTELVEILRGNRTRRLVTSLAPMHTGKI